MQWNPVVWVSEARRFLEEVRAEFRKITWPTYLEARAGTIGVLIVVGVMTVVLSVVDYGLGWAIQLLLPS
jgi:preprotein translocase SecE subunit